MAAKLCLRCDWTGRTSSASCPRCGAQMYDRTDRERDGSATERSWRGWIATGLVVVLAAVAFVTIQHFTPATAPSSANTTGLQGYLVYPAPDAGRERLWIWDLAAGTVQPGPVVHAVPSALVTTYSVEDSWVGLTIPRGDGASEAAVLRGADPGAQPVQLGSGHIVAWQEGGAFVSLVRSEPRGGCRNRLVVATVSLADRISGRSLDQTVCGRPVGLLRDSTSPYVTLRTARDVTVDRVAADTLSPILRGYSALGATLNGDFLVRAPESAGRDVLPRAGGASAGDDLAARPAARRDQAARVEHGRQRRVRPRLHRRGRWRVRDHRWDHGRSRARRASCSGRHRPPLRPRSRRRTTCTSLPTGPFGSSTRAR